MSKIRGATANCFSRSDGAGSEARSCRFTSCFMGFSMELADGAKINLGERQSNTNNSLRAMHPGKNAITLLFVALRLTGSRQGNKGHPLPTPLIGCLCWLRHMRLAGSEGPAPGAGRWQRLMSCRSAAEL